MIYILLYKRFIIQKCDIKLVIKNVEFPGYTYTYTI